MTLFKTLKDLNARRHTALVANGSRDVTNFMPQNDKEDASEFQKKCIPVARKTNFKIFGTTIFKEFEAKII